MPVVASSLGDSDARDHRLRDTAHWRLVDASLIMPGCPPLSHRDIVFGMANKESAHVDDDMPPAYRSVVESKAIQVKVGDSEVQVINVTRLVCGSAGLELLECLT